MTAAAYGDGARSPLFNMGAEKAVIGALFLDAKALSIAADVLRPDHFYEPLHRRVYEAAQSLSADGEPVDEITVGDRLEATGAFQDGDHHAVSVLAEGAYSAANVEQYARIVRDCALLRSTKTVAEEIIAGAQKADSRDAEIYLAKSTERLLQLARGCAPSGPVALADDAGPAAERLRERARFGGVSGLRTGFVDIDNALGGMRPGHLWVIAGRPSMGKTAFAMNVAANVAVDQGRPVLFFSLEMPREDLVTRLICERAGVPAEWFSTGQGAECHGDTVSATAERIQDAPLYIDDTAGLDITTLHARSRRMKEQQGLALVVIDYLQLVRPGPGRHDSREREVAAVSAACKGVAKELGVPVMLLAQLNRAVESTEDKRPGLVHLRESGAIEQDADVVAFLYRREYYFPAEREADGLADLLIRKNRHGRAPSIPLAWRGELTRFSDLAREDVYP